MKGQGIVNNIHLKSFYGSWSALLGTCILTKNGKQLIQYIQMNWFYPLTATLFKLLIGYIFPLPDHLGQIPIKKFNICIWLELMIYLHILYIHSPVCIWEGLKWYHCSYKFVLIKETEIFFNWKACFRIKYWGMDYYFCCCSKSRLYFPMGSNDVKA